jgi:hypothetical protein
MKIDDKKRDDAQHNLELHTDNVMILERDLEKLHKELGSLVGLLQRQMEEIDVPFVKARTAYETAQRQFERAQKIFFQEEQAFRHSHDVYDRKKASLQRDTDQKRRTLEEAIRKKENDVRLEKMKVQNAQRDIDDLSRR